MGIYTDYGRFIKAREFKRWCNSGAGIWFGFGMGSPRWDYEVKTNDNSSKPNVPTSSPAAYTPLYRWYAKYNDPSWSDPSGTDLADQEYAFLDRSYIIPTEAMPDPIPTEPTNSDLRNNALTTPSDDLSPSISRLISGLNPSISTTLWDPAYAGSDSSSQYYPSPSIPVFPATYRADWDAHISDYSSDTTVPTDPEDFEEYAYNIYFHKILGRNAPLGLLSYIQGKAVFVEPIKDSELQDSLKMFKYGAHYWRIVPDTEVNSKKLPHHVLLTVSVFPNELIDDTIAERYLLVRQVSVFKFPDYLVTEWELDTTPLPRSKQVIPASKINMLYPGAYRMTNLFNIPFNCRNPMEPNSGTYSSDCTIEMLINDFMTGRKRDVQQTDRYGYIIGF